MSQYENYSDEKLAEHRQEIQVEEDKRAKREKIPTLFETYTREYLASGGKKKDLLDAIERGTKTEEEAAGIEPEAEPQVESE